MWFKDPLSSLYCLDPNQPGAFELTGLWQKADTPQHRGEGDGPPYWFPAEWEEMGGTERSRTRGCCGPDAGLDLSTGCLCGLCHSWHHCSHLSNGAGSWALRSTSWEVLLRYRKWDLCAAREIKGWVPRGGPTAACPLSSSWLPVLYRAHCVALGTAETSAEVRHWASPLSSPVLGHRFKILD